MQSRLPSGRTGKFRACFTCSVLPETQTRSEELEKHGRHYGELHLAIAFTTGMSGPYEFKQVKNWKQAERLPDGNFGAGLLKGRGERRNPAVCLQASGLVGIDVDGVEGRILARQLAPGQWPPTVAVRSGRADEGLHMWYRANRKTQKHKIQIAHSLMLSADGYFIVPPAWHTLAERPYEFLPGRAPWEIEIALFPEWLQEHLGERAEAKDVEQRADDRSPITEGERHYHLLRIAGAMRHAGAGEPEILAALRTLNARRCVPPKSELEVRKLAHDIVRRYSPGL